MEHDNNNPVDSASSVDLAASDLPEGYQDSNCSHETKGHADEDGESLEEYKEHVMGKHEIVSSVVFAEHCSQLVVVGEEADTVEEGGDAYQTVQEAPDDEDSGDKLETGQPVKSEEVIG